MRAPGNSKLYFCATLFAAWGAFVLPAACVPEKPGVKTVWDRIMEEQGALNLRKGYAFMGEENYPAAADEFFKAAQKSPENPWPRLLYGSALYWLGEPQKALDEFEAALRLDPENSMAFQLRGIVRARAGQYQEALDDFLRAEVLAPERADVKMNAGSVYHALGNFARALDYFRAAVQRDAENPLYRYQLGMFYSRLGRYEQAAAELERAAALFPAYEDALFELAVLREREGKLDEAVKLYRKALALKPGDSAARFRLCWALVKARRQGEIAKALAGAFLLAPANEKGGISMALAYAGGAAATGGDNGSSAAGAAGGSGGPLFSALSRIPPEQEARVEVELLETPRAGSLQKAAPETGRGGGKLAAALARPKVSYSKREYFLAASGPEERLKRAAAVAAEVAKLSKSVAPGNDSRLSFNIETGLPAGNNTESKKKALYKPRDVGNDMGLWVMGDNWLENVGEALEEMEAHPAVTWPEFKLVRGLGYLLLGEAEQSLADFSGGGAQAALGRSAAWVAAGDPERALAACLEALKLEPGNKTALANRGWLEVKK
ncbi:MAG TPA: tetratricopeptide repeat protein [Elusimicrobiales bacterium]|nr:tetratricopeptide repeat protein [Elusimicrobiales bacterium]